MTDYFACFACGFFLGMLTLGLVALTLVTP